MEPRLDYSKAAPGVMHAMLGFHKYLSGCGLPKPLLDLVYLRASQINGCAYCIDMHWKDLRAEGETEQRLYGLNAWEDSSYYTEKERAALAWTEAVTRLRHRQVPDVIFEVARAFFSEKELADLTLAVVAINGWNRLNIAFHAPAGTYQPGQWAETETKEPVGASR